MKNLLTDEKYGFISRNDKDFITAYTGAMKDMGYVHNGIEKYVCWGKYMIAYLKEGIKTKKYVSRFYLRDDGVIFRMYFTNIDFHREYIENAPEFIKSAFTGSQGDCRHCSNKCKDENGNCSHRKTYTIDEKAYEKCDGEVFLFENHETENIPEYMKLLREFYPAKKKTASV
jgi:hypothetical protein